MKIGRNQSCPCGSGKKYKNCCMSKAAVSSQALYYRRLSEAHDRLVEHLVAFGERIFDEKVVEAAIDEFLLWPKQEDETSSEMLDRAGTLFWPWFLHNWTYDVEDTGEELDVPDDHTIAELYAREHTSRLDPLEEILIESIDRKPYSFYEVLSVNRGTGMTLRDTLTSTQFEVQERSGSENVQPGDILFGRAVVVDGVGMILGLSQTLIPPARKTDVILLRKQLRQHQTPVTDDTLRKWEVEVRECYFRIDQSLHTMPQICNTDGHKMELHRLIYDVSSADEAFEKLSGLCVTMTPDEMSIDAERDDAGRLIKVEIPWDRKGHKGNPGLSNTVLGRLVIDGNRLTAEVNSAQRAAKLRREIDTRLGDGSQFRADEIQDLDSMMSKHEAGSPERKSLKEHEELMQHPEVREHLAEMTAKFWESWVDEKIPAQGEKSPREAVKTADGRESVEALLNDAERERGQDAFTVEVNRKGTQRVREMLGLNQ
jgi:hypothetical protein